MITINQLLAPLSRNTEPDTRCSCFFWSGGNELLVFQGLLMFAQVNRAKYETDVLISSGALQSRPSCLCLPIKLLKAVGCQLSGWWATSQKAAKLVSSSFGVSFELQLKCVGCMLFFDFWDNTFLFLWSGDGVFLTVVALLFLNYFLSLLIFTLQTLLPCSHFFQLFILIFTT